MSNIQILMAYFKSTKGTHVYKTENPDAAIQSVYIKRDALPIVPPKGIQITLEFDDK